MEIKKDNIINYITQYESIDESIRNYLYPKLYQLYKEGKINNGHLPKNKEAEDSLRIIAFYLNKDKISVDFDIHWGGDIYDPFTLSMTPEDWDKI